MTEENLNKKQVGELPSPKILRPEFQEEKLREENMEDDIIKKIRIIIIDDFFDIHLVEDAIYNDQVEEDYIKKSILKKKLLERFDKWKKFDFKLLEELGIDI